MQRVRGLFLLGGSTAAGLLLLPKTKRDLAHTAAGGSPADCAEPACHSKADLFKSALATNKKPPPANLSSAPDREEIGRAGWTILHTFAAYYPEEPSEEDVEMARAFLQSFARFYPCRDCAKGFEADLVENPPRLDSRTSFSLYVCEAHNRVNEQLGKPLVRCDIKSLDLAWRGRSVSPKV